MFYPNFYLRRVTKQLLLLCGTFIIVFAFLMGTMLFYLNNLKTHQIYYKALENRSINLTLEQQVALKSDLTLKGSSRLDSPYDLQAYWLRTNNRTLDSQLTPGSNNTYSPDLTKNSYRPFIKLGVVPTSKQTVVRMKAKPSFATMGNCNDFYIINGYFYLTFHCYTTLVCFTIVVLYIKILLLARKHQRQIMSATGYNGVPDIVRAPTGVKVGNQ